MLVGRGLHLTKGPQGPRVVNRTLTDRIDVLDNLKPRGLIPDIAGSPTVQVVPSISAAIGVSAINGLHTTAVAADEKPTTLLVCYASIEGGEEPDPTSPCTFEGEALELVGDTGDTASNTDVRILVYQLKNPPIVTDGDTIFNWLYGAAPVAVIWENYSDADEAVLLSQSVNTDPVSASILAAGGVDTSLMIAFSVAQNINMGPPSFSNGFSMFPNGTTGSDVDDFYYAKASIAAAAPIGTTASWNDSNEATAVLVEIKSKSTLVNQRVLKDTVSVIDFANVPTDSVTTSRTLQDSIDVTDDITAGYVPVSASPDITFPGSITVQKVDAGVSGQSILNGLHTVPTGTDLLMALVGIEGSEAPQTPTPCSFESVALDLITDIGSSGDNKDVRMLAYGQLSPTVIADGDTIFNWFFSAAPVVVVWINVAGVDTTSLSSAVELVSSAVNTSATATAVLASGGSSGDALLAWAVGQGSSMSPASLIGDFTEQQDDTTGASSNDFGFLLATSANGAPSGTTISFGDTNENTAMLLTFKRPAAGPVTNNITLTDNIAVTDSMIVTRDGSINNNVVLTDTIAVRDTLVKSGVALDSDPDGPLIWATLYGRRTYTQDDTDGEEIRVSIAKCHGVDLGMYYNGPWDRGDFGYLSRKDVADDLHTKNTDLIANDYVDIQEGGDPGNDVRISNKLNSEVGPTGNGGTWTPNDWWLRDDTGARTSTFSSASGTAWHTNLSSYVTADSEGFYFAEWIARRNHDEVYIDPHSVPGTVAGGVGLFLDVFDRRIRLNDTDMDRDGVQDHARTGALPLGENSVWADNYRLGHALYFDTMLDMYPNIFLNCNATTWGRELQDFALLETTEMHPEIAGRAEGGFSENMTNEGGFPLSGIMHDGETFEDYRLRVFGLTESFGNWQRMAFQIRYVKLNLVKRKCSILGAKIDINPNRSLYPQAGTSFDVARWVMGTGALFGCYVAITDNADEYGTTPHFDEQGIEGTAITGLKKGWLGQPVGGYVTEPVKINLWVIEYDNGYVCVNPSRTSSVSIVTGTDVPTGLYRINGAQDTSHNDGSLFTGMTLAAHDAIFLVKPGIFAAYP